MDNHIGIGKDFLHGIVAGIAQGDIVGVAGLTTLVPVYLAVFPHHAAIGLVAYLYPFWLDTFVL